MKVAEYVDIGQYLRESRESLHITVEQAASALHIRAKYLRALESGNLDDLPGKAYIRGYIRNYVEYLRLDSEEVLEVYESLLAHKGQGFFIPEPTLKQNLPSRRIIRGAVLGMVLLYGYWYFALHDSTPAPATIAEVPQEFMQMLDKTPRAAMDKTWEGCVDSGSIDCFIALRRQATTLQSNVYYDASFKSIPPQKP